MKNHHKLKNLFRRLLYNKVTSDDNKESVIDAEDYPEGFGNGVSGIGTLRCHNNWPGHSETGIAHSFTLGRGILPPPPMQSLMFL